MDAELNAQIDGTWNKVRLRVDQVRADTFRALVQAWAEDPDGVADVLDKLAAAAEAGPAAAWEAALENAEIDLQMDHAEVELDETRALQLADELRDAAAQTFTARIRKQPIQLPHQQGEVAA